MIVYNTGFLQIADTIGSMINVTSTMLNADANTTELIFKEVTVKENLSVKCHIILI